MMDEIQETKSGSVKTFLTSRRFLKPFLSVLIGGIAGFLYYHFVGCASGQCALTSSPYTSTIFGGLLGLFITSSPCANNKC